MCNETGNDIDTGLTKNQATLYIDTDTVDDLVYAINMGAGTSALIAILSQSGVISAPPGWLAAAISVVLYMIGDTLSYVDDGCGIELSITVYTGVPKPVYSLSAQ